MKTKLAQLGFVACLLLVAWVLLQSVSAGWRCRPDGTAYFCPCVEDQRPCGCSDGYIYDLDYALPGCEFPIEWVEPNWLYGYIANVWVTQIVNGVSGVLCDAAPSDPCITNIIGTWTGNWYTECIDGNPNFPCDCDNYGGPASGVITLLGYCHENNPGDLNLYFCETNGLGWGWYVEYGDGSFTMDGSNYFHAYSLSTWTVPPSCVP